MIEIIGIEPVEGELDVAKVEAFLVALPLVVRDPHDPHHFMSHYALR